MKKYIQLTAGRGPVECARVVTLVAREPDLGAELLELGHTRSYACCP